MARGVWSICGAVLFGGVFALFGYLRVDAVDSQAIRGLMSFFLFGFYCAIVAFGTSGKKRTLSLPGQTLLGMAMACAVAALLRASPEGYVAAILAGLVLGFTADKWVEHVQLP